MNEEHVETKLRQRPSLAQHDSNNDRKDDDDDGGGDVERGITARGNECKYQELVRFYNNVYRLAIFLMVVFGILLVVVFLQTPSSLLGHQEERVFVSIKMFLYCVTLPLYLVSIAFLIMFREDVRIGVFFVFISTAITFYQFGILTYFLFEYYVYAHHQQQLVSQYPPNATLA